MRTAFLFSISLLLQSLVLAQSNWDVQSGLSPEPFVASDQVKIYNRNGLPLTIYVRYENGPWQKETLEEGFIICELAVCGKPKGTNCNVALRIYSTRQQFREISLTGGSRYMTLYDSQLKLYYFQEVR